MRSFVILIALLCPCAVAPAQPHAKDADLAVRTPESMNWMDAPPSLPPGAKIAVLEGDPGKEGPFVFRAKLPDGYRIPPHTHPKTERITVLAGTFHVGMGEKFDSARAKALTAGTYGFWPAGMKHYVFAEGETVIQFHGNGPWSLTYVNPADDPRNQRK
jgi:quercetin dioxygenase-like cupin family protein